MHALLAEIAYPVIDPILLDLGKVKVRWYGVTYVLAFVLAWVVLTKLAKRGRWPVAPERVGDVLFYGILGVFVGGRLGYMFFYALPMGTFTWGGILRVWEGGMSFHGGLLGVIVAYTIYAMRGRTPEGGKIPPGQLFDGLALATPIGIFFVRMANFINGELYGRVWDGAWAMRFPRYDIWRKVDGTPIPRPKGREAAEAAMERGDLLGPENWNPDAPAAWLSELRHPSQLYEAFAEGIFLFAILWFLMFKRGWGNGRIAGAFLFLYGTFRFLIEYTREPDKALGLKYLDAFTQGQLLCFVMIIVGIITFWRSKRPMLHEEQFQQ